MILSGLVSFTFSVVTFFGTNYYNESKSKDLVKKEVSIGLSKIVEMQQLNNDNAQIIASNLESMLSTKRIPNSNIQILNKNIERINTILESSELQGIKNQKYDITKDTKTSRRFPASVER